MLGDKRLTSNVQLAYFFSQKAKVNAEFTRAALRGMGRSAIENRGVPAIGALPTLGLQTAIQLIMEGIELTLKALVLMRGNSPSPRHRLRQLFDRIEDSDKNLVECIVQNAIAQSSKGPVPFGLPNVASATLMGGPLGEPDPSSGYSNMNAKQFFDLLDAAWRSQYSQYLGADLRFTTHGILRASTRVLAGAISVCTELAENSIGRIEKLVES